MVKWCRWSLYYDHNDSDADDDGDVDHDSDETNIAFDPNPISLGIICVSEMSYNVASWLLLMHNYL